MGRGRQKAKQTKVARKLKYYSPDTDLEALQRELASTQHHDPYVHYDPYEQYVDDATDEDDDQYAAYAEKYADVDFEDDSEDTADDDQDFDWKKAPRHK